MKKPIALMLISIMVLMLSAFSFAGNGTPLNDKDHSRVNAFVLDDELFITVWLDAEIGDQLEELSFEVVEDEDVSSDEYVVESVFGSKMYKYTFEAIDFTPLDDFEVRVIAELDTDNDGDADEELVLNKKVDLEDLDEEEDEEDEEEDMDDDMYPAAPAVANKLLKEQGIPNRVNGINLIAAVAAEFADADKTDGEFAEDVEEFLIDRLNEALEDELDDEIDELSDLDEYFDKMDKEMVNSEVNKIKVKITDVVNNDDIEDDDEEDEDDNDDEDDDEDEDEDDEDEDEDNSDKEKPNKK